MNEPCNYEVNTLKTLLRLVLLKRERGREWQSTSAVFLFFSYFFSFFYSTTQIHLSGKHLHVVRGRVFSSIPAAVPSLSAPLFIQTCEFRLFLPGLIPRAERGGKLGRVTPVAPDVLNEPEPGEIKAPPRVESRYTENEKLLNTSQCLHVGGGTGCCRW